MPSAFHEILPTDYMLAVSPHLAVYLEREESILADYLDKLESATVPHQIMYPQDLYLSQYGALKGNFRLTTIALAQLCQKLCPGLTKLIFELSGTLDSTAKTADRVSSSVKIINEVISARFDRLERKQLLRNNMKRSVDGITGTGYHFLSNNIFYQQIKDASSYSKRHCKFIGASMSGRRLSVYFAALEPLITISGYGTFYCGYTLANSETGDCSVRSYTSLILPDKTIGKLAVARRSTEQFRVPHSGHGFHRKFVTAATRTFSDVDATDDDELKRGLELAATTDLGFGKLSKSVHDSRMLKFVHELRRHGLSTPLAEAVMSVAIYRGTGTNKAPLQVDYIMNDWRSRTMLDIVVALMTLSTTANFNNQSLLEKLAFDILVSKVHLLR